MPTPITQSTIGTAVNAWVADPVATETTYGHIKDWDTINVTNMSNLFRDKDNFNDDISGWNVSNVTDMSLMFYNVYKAFNQDISGWDVSNVTNMSHMFYNTKALSAPLQYWNTTKVTDFNNMFQDAWGLNALGFPRTPDQSHFNVPPPSPCFPAGTPIQTDQGVTVIEQLVPGEHTLRGKSILAITQTRPLQKHIVCFEKDSIGKNVPSTQTLCSKEHKVLYKGEMTKARDLADMCKNVKKVSYNGETLYNVLLEKHGKMLVNNMICETLHPENIAAKFAKAKSSVKRNAAHM